MNKLSKQPVSKNEILANAFFKIAEQFNLTEDQIATIFGISQL